MKMLNLGCGAHPLPGWVNLDLERREGVIYADLSTGLPAHLSGFDVVYSEHFIEHISFAAALWLFQDIYKAMNPGGVLRLSTPDLRFLMGQYFEGRTTEWREIWNPTSPCQMVNQGMRMWGHEFLWDFEELRRELLGVGFKEVRGCLWGHSEVSALKGIEKRPFHGELVIEAVKS